MKCPLKLWTSNHQVETCSSGNSMWKSAIGEVALLHHHILEYPTTATKFDAMNI